MSPRILLALLFPLVLAGCAVDREPAEASGTSDTVVARRAAHEAAASSEEMRTVAVSVNRHLILSPRWTRAEDLALTLQELYPNARIVPHVPSNKVFVYIPDPTDRSEAAAGSPRGPATMGRSRQGMRR